MERPSYDYTAIEKKWQQRWAVEKTFEVDETSEKEKYYLLDMFPYPSGEGLHVGHLVGYTATDILARYKRQKGLNVLHPMGWDSFGLPAEQYAIRTGQHPSVTTKKNIDTFRRQLQSLGFSYDWSRELSTSDPTYYKWTQWLFIRLYEKGLAYQAEMPVHYCPKLGTVLANEEIEQGRSKIGGYLVEQRLLKQWVLKITAFADRLLADLDTIDWPEHLKLMQRHWIGRSEGATIAFKAKGLTLEIFTSRPETVFGVTFIALSATHPLLPHLIVPSRQEEVSACQSAIAKESAREEQRFFGVWTGSYAEHPISKTALPIYVASYVLSDYGSGAVMGVPAHDERDAQFATIYDLPCCQILEEDGEKLCHSACDDFSLNGLTIEHARTAALQELGRLGVAKKSVHYKLRDWLFARQRYWGEPFPLLYLEDGSIRVLGIDELPLMSPTLVDYKPVDGGISPLERAPEWVFITDPVTGKPARRDLNTMPQWAGSCWYYLRFCDPHNSAVPFALEKERYWMPVDLYVGGAEHAVMHLLYARFWHKVFYDCGLVSGKEPFASLRNQGIVVAPSYKDPLGNYVSLDEVLEKGQGEEKRYISKKNGDPLTRQLEKMSKSKLNGVSPDDIRARFGADTLRLYAMFMGPFDKEKVWNDDAIIGCYRFLKRIYMFAQKVSSSGSASLLKEAKRVVLFVEQQIELFGFNSAIARMMEFLNELERAQPCCFLVWRFFIQALYPFAPHLAEELWEAMGSPQRLAYTPYPTIDPSQLEEEELMFIIQINGKFRAKLLLPKGSSQEQVWSVAQKEASKYLQGQTVDRMIFVPDRLLNIVLS